MASSSYTQVETTYFGSPACTVNGLPLPCQQANGVIKFSNSFCGQECARQSSFHLVVAGQVALAATPECRVTTFDANDQVLDYAEAALRSPEVYPLGFNVVIDPLSLEEGRSTAVLVHFDYRVPA